MASIRSARVLTVSAALPLAAVLLGGVAQADNGGFADDGSNVSVATVPGSGVGGAGFGDPSTAQQVATGWGASNQSHTARFDGVGFAVVDQGDVTVNFSPLW